MTDKQMPPAEIDALVQKVWDESQAKIKENIEYAIRSELTTRAQTTTRKNMDALLAPLIKKVVEERADFIKAALVKRGEEVVERALDRFDQAFRFQMQQSLAQAVREPFDTLGVKLSDMMFHIVEDVIQARAREQEKKREAERWRKRQAEEEGKAP
jgi:hypothetical protein